MGRAAAICPPGAPHCERARDSHDNASRRTSQYQIRRPGRKEGRSGAYARRAHQAVAMPRISGSSETGPKSQKLFASNADRRANRRGRSAGWRAGALRAQEHLHDTCRSQAFRTPTRMQKSQAPCVQQDARSSLNATAWRRWKRRSCGARRWRRRSRRLSSSFVGRAAASSSPAWASPAISAARSPRLSPPRASPPTSSIRARRAMAISA